MEINKAIKRILVGNYQVAGGYVMLAEGLTVRQHGPAQGWMETQLFGVCHTKRYFEVNDRLPAQLLEEIQAAFADKGLLVRLEELPDAIMMLHRPMVGVPILYMATMEDGLLAITAYTGRRPLGRLVMNWKLGRLIAQLPGELVKAAPPEEAAEEPKPEKKKKINPFQKKKNAE